MAASEIRRLWILHAGEERLIQNALRAEMRSDGDSWTVHLVAPRAAFPREVEDGQLVRLRLESDTRVVEGYARMRVLGPVAWREVSDLHVLLEGEEAMRTLETLSAQTQGARIEALAQVGSSWLAATGK